MRPLFSRPHATDTADARLCGVMDARDNRIAIPREPRRRYDR
jgi:hypothetical protein